VFFYKGKGTVHALEITKETKVLFNLITFYFYSLAYFALSETMFVGSKRVFFDRSIRLHLLAYFETAGGGKFYTTLAIISSNFVLLISLSRKNINL